MKYKIIQEKSGDVIVDEAQVAVTFVSRLMGLMFKKGMKENSALIFYKCPSIHMFFMFFAIDIVFLDKYDQILRICNCLKPWRAVLCSEAATTIEFPAQKASQNALKVGDKLLIVPNTSTE